MSNTEINYNHVEHFQRFAQILARDFDVQINLEGTNAFADGNKTITLPNILSIDMTEDDMNFVIGVLLHEICHIKWSSFDAKLFGSIINQNQFMIVNNLEDARVENVMMKKYDGAKEYFDRLYNYNKEQMKKIFKMEFGLNLWHTFCCGVHDYIVNLEIIKPPTKYDKEVTKMLDKVRPIIDAPKLNSSEDANILGLKIYNVFIDAAKDKSQKLMFKETQEKIDKVKKSFENIIETNTKEFQKIKELRQKLNQLRKESDELKEKNKKFFDQPENKLTRELYSAADNVKRLKDYINNNDDSNKKLEDRDKRYSEVIKKFEQAKNDLEKTLNSPESKGKKTKLTQKLNKLLSKIKKLSKKIDDLKKKVNANYGSKRAYEEAIKRNEELISKSGLTKEQIDQKFDKLNKESNQDAVKIAKLNSQIRDMESQIKCLKDKLKFDMKGKFKEQYNEIMEAAKSGELGPMKPQDILGENPGFEFQDDPDWKEADEVQKRFDKNAEKVTDDIVNNGMSPFGHNVRELYKYIDYTRNNLDYIDLAKIFNDRCRDSKLDQINDYLSEINNTREIKDEKDTVIKATKQHIPVTTKFDITEYAPKSLINNEIPEIKNKFRGLINKLGELLKIKMRVKRRVRFKPNQENGSLDTRELHRVIIDPNDNLYEIIDPRFENKTRAILAIDISGSMDKAESSYGKKLKELTTILSSALDIAHVKSEVIGFSAPICESMKDCNSTLYNRKRNNLKHTIYKDKNYDALASIDIDSADNSDGESIRAMGNRLNKTAAKRKILFIISDGRPFLSEADTEILDADLMKTIGHLIKNKIEVYAFGFNDSPAQFYKNHYLKIDNYNDIMPFVHKTMARE